ncbi:hypothetical protein COCC4DRAFT_140136, partial [Bipolaris maydis ATCC 48331]
LNVGCFSPLKLTYSCKVESHICYYINYTAQLEFLLAFKAAYDQSFTLAGIYSAFYSASLMPL